ncbi:MAG: sensor histidine kinase [Pseudomonadota bacterium]
MLLTRSLRTRLFVMIIAPLTALACVLGLWRYQVAQGTANEVFDRALLSVALAVSRDITVSGGDALSPTTRDLISEAAGGDIFYHATGPDGIYIAGYSYPPVQPGQSDPAVGAPPRYAEARYRGNAVRVLQLTERVSVDGLSGDATVTVWQRNSDRQALTRDLARRAAGLIGALLLTLAAVVWFGVQWGLKPLTKLQDAISARSADDLSTIKRRVPREARGIVATLNRLFSQVRDSIDAQQAFISEAAHQLRNPAAAVQSLAEAVRDAPEGAERQRRVVELVAASRDAARVAEQLLSLERLRLSSRAVRLSCHDLNALCRDACESAAVAVLARDIGFELQLAEAALPVDVEPVLIEEALKNLIDNALTHGGDALTRIAVRTHGQPGCAVVTVEDDGTGLSPDDQSLAFGRFSQLAPGAGSGLGLSIARSVAERHGGTLKINDCTRGASLSLSLPTAG